MRVFGPSTAGGTSFAGVESEVALITDASTATSAFQILKQFARERKERHVLLQAFVQGFNQGAGGTVLRFRDFHFRRVHALRVGARSFVLPATFAVRGVQFSLQLLFVKVDRAIGQIGLVAIGKIRAADARTLARAIANHMRAILGASTAGTPTHQ